MIQIYGWQSVIVALVFFCWTHDAVAQGFRQDPACLEEQLTREMVMAKISDYQRGDIPVPGRVIIENSNWGPHWRKLEMHEVHRRAVRTWPLGGFATQRRYVEIHFMVNLATKEVKQVKFKNTVEQGCEGTLERAGETRPRPAGGSVPDYGGSSLPERRGEVIVGPVRPAEHPPFPGHTSCASCHAGTMGSFNRVAPLKTPSHRFKLAAASTGRASRATSMDEDLSQLNADQHLMIAAAEPPRRGRVLDSIL